MFFNKRKQQELTFDMLNQRQLTVLRFRKHKLAVAALFFLATIYIVAIFAEFAAPYNPSNRNLDYCYSPPNKIGFFSVKRWTLRKGTTTKS